MSKPSRWFGQLLAGAGGGGWQRIRVDDHAATVTRSASAWLGQVGAKRIIIANLLAGGNRPKRDDAGIDLARRGHTFLQARVWIAGMVNPACLVNHVEIKSFVNFQRIIIVDVLPLAPRHAVDFG